MLVAALSTNVPSRLVRLAVAISLTALFSVGIAAAAADSDGRPNIVLVMADDLGYGDLGCYHVDNPLWPDAPPPSTPTPNLDRLAGRGVRFLDYHAQPVCSPTRAALMTGRYPQRSGVDGVIYADPKQNRHHGLQPSEWTLAEALREAGYTTAAFGKWHLGYDVAFNPLEHGFDRFVGYVSGNIDYVSHLDRMGIPDWYDGRRLRPEHGYVTYLITEHAERFVREQATSDEPYFVYVAHECPHDPIQKPGDPPTRRSGHVGNLWTPKGKERDASRRAMIAAMDEGVGRLMEAIAEAGDSRPTLLLFCSDNGAVPFGDNGPWRGNKGSIFEGGQRVPLIVSRYDGTDSNARDSDAVCMTADLMPTLCDYAGAAPSQADRPIDGVSLRPILDDASAVLADRTIFQQYRGAGFARRGRLKYVIDRPGRKGRSSDALYNLTVSPDESQPSADDAAKAELAAAYRSWAAAVAADATPQPSHP